ncbi:Ferritin BfrB [bacterium HR16]|nr:Ferritin BfrB [bacterium HR16]
MLISEELNKAFNEEIGRELFASHQYIAIASYFDGRALKKLAEMFFKQSEEEREHAMKFVDYLNDVNGKVEIPAVQAPKNDFQSAEEAVRLALEWELEVTKHINDLMTLAIEQKDYAAQEFLDWFVKEQVEEVSTMQDLLQIVQQVGEHYLIMVEAYLSHGGGG